MKVLKPDPNPADKGKEMGAPAVTTTPFRLQPARETTTMRRTGIWMSVVGAVLTLVGGLTVLVTRGDSDAAKLPGQGQAVSASEAGGSTATTTRSARAAGRWPTCTTRA